MVHVSDQSSSYRARLSLVTLGLLFLVITAGTFSSLGVVLPDMVGALGWSWTQAGLGFTVLAVTCGLASYAPTVVIRTLGVRATLAAGGAVMAAGFACLFIARDVDLYLLGAALEGVGFALTTVIPGAFVLSHLFRRPSAALGVYFTLGGLGGVAGPWFYIVSRAVSHDWRSYWLALAIVSLLLALAAAASIDPAAMDDAEEAAGEAPVASPADTRTRDLRDWTARAALATSQFWIIVAAYTVNLLVEVTINGLSVEHLKEHGVAAGVAGGMLSLQAMFGVLGRIAGGWVGDRIDPRRLVMIGLSAMIAGIAALTVARGGPLMIVYAVSVGFGYGLNYLAATVMLLKAFGRRRNLELFSTLCLISTLAAVGPVLAGRIRDLTGGFAPVFWLFAGVTGLVLVAVAWMKPLRSAFTAG